MKRLVLSLGLVVLVTHGPATPNAGNALDASVSVHADTALAPASVPAHDGQVDTEKITVYVTRTGAKYHRDGCRYLSRSKIAMSLKEAAKRFDPCKVCRPPVLTK